MQYETMKRILTPQSRGLLIARRVMVLLIIVLILLVIGGTIYGFVRPPASAPLFRIGGSGAADTRGGIAGANDAVSVFTGIGRLRIPLDGAGTLILSIAFPYPPNDQAFTEELAAKIGNFRDMAAGYFSSLPPEKLVNLDEDAAKTEILRRYNTSLRLGKIETLYFSDLMIVE
jgi:flagellar basal body-associated protein FliL